MKCFYHADADGRCAGFWVLAKGVFEGDELGYFIEINYGKPFPLDIIQPNEVVYIVDYSIEPEEMIELLKITQNVIWIDHHKTAIEKYADFPYRVKGLRKDGIAGCMLTYCFLNIMCDSTGEIIRPFDMWMTDSAPMFTKLIADWDVWKFEFGDDTRNFITAFNAYDFAPNSNNWENFINRVDEDPNRNMYNDHYTMELIHQGAIMRLYRDHWAKEYCRTKGFEVELEGYKAYALNLGLCNSEYFKSIEYKEYDILMPFCFDGKLWVFSLYSKTIDVSEIAKRYGGGGHRGAAGFQMDYLPSFVDERLTRYERFCGFDLASGPAPEFMKKEFIIPVKNDEELKKPQG
jgi:oligoribonuclease NrnB/cAMP/cGMP phosphodiesterase (DHH superfamily)